MRLEAYTADSLIAERIADRAKDVYGGATITTGIGVTEEWGREDTYIVVTFADDTDSRWAGIIRHAMHEREEDSVMGVRDNDNFFVENPTPERSGS